MEQKTAMLNEYASKPKSKQIRQLRELFRDKQDSPKTEAEEAYTRKLSTADPASALKNAAIKDLLKFHWGSYDYDTWTRGMDEIAKLLSLGKVEEEDNNTKQDCFFERVQRQIILAFYSKNFWFIRHIYSE